MATEYTRATHSQYATAAYRLFHFKYDVLAQRVDLMSDFEREVIGIPITGDPDIDANPRGGLDRGRINVMTMAKLNARGAKFAIRDPNDAILIYSDIQMHLGDWLRGLDEFAFRNRCPLKSLELFEQLAEQLHFFAASHLDGREVDRVAINNVLMVGRRDRTHTPAQGVMIGEYVSTVNQIKRKMAIEKFGLYDPNNED